MVDVKLYGDSASAQKWVGWAKKKLELIKLTQPDQEVFTKKYALPDADVSISKVEDQEYIKVFGKGNQFLVVWFGRTSLNYDSKKFFFLAGETLVEIPDIFQYIDDGLYEIDRDASPSYISNMFSATYNKDGGGLGIPALLYAGYDSKGPKRYVLNRAPFKEIGTMWEEDVLNEFSQTVFTIHSVETHLALTSRYFTVDVFSPELLIYRDEDIIHVSSCFKNESGALQWDTLTSDNFVDLVCLVKYFSYIDYEGNRSSYNIGTLYSAGSDFKNGENFNLVKFERHARAYMGTPWEWHRRYYNFLEPFRKTHISEEGGITHQDNFFRRTWDNTDPTTHNGHIFYNIGRRRKGLTDDSTPPDPPPAPDENDTYSYIKYVGNPSCRIPFGSYEDRADYIEIKMGHPEMSSPSWKWNDAYIALYIGGKKVEEYTQNSIRVLTADDDFNTWFDAVTLFEYRFYPYCVCHTKDMDAAVYAKARRIGYQEIMETGWTLTHWGDEFEIERFFVLEAELEITYHLCINGKSYSLLYADGSPIVTHQLEYMIKCTKETTRTKNSVKYHYQPHQVGHSFVNMGYDYKKNEKPNHSTKYLDSVYLSISGDSVMVMAHVYDQKVCHTIQTQVAYCDNIGGEEYCNFYIYGEYDTSINSWPPWTDKVGTQGNLVDRIMMVANTSGNVKVVKNLTEAFRDPNSPPDAPYVFKCVNGIGMFNLQ